MTRQLLSDAQTQIIRFVGVFLLTLFLVHEWLGYPWVTATQPNAYWEIVRLNLEILAWAIFLFFPVLLAVSGIMLFINAIVWILSATYYKVKP